MEYKKIINGFNCTIEISGCIVFKDYVKFKDILNVIFLENLKNIEFDLSKIESIEPAALGLFLVIKDECKKRNIDLIISNPNKNILRMFKGVNFDNLFKIIKTPLA